MRFPDIINNLKSGNTTFQMSQRLIPITNKQFQYFMGAAYTAPAAKPPVVQSILFQRAAIKLFKVLYRETV